jgi:ABC-type transporter Mla MlaB component
MMAHIELSPEGSTLKVSGDLTFMTAVPMRRLGERCIAESNHQTVQCDFSLVQRCESVGLLLMIAWVRYAKQRHKKIIWLNIPDALFRMSEVCGLRFLLEDFHG